MPEELKRSLKVFLCHASADKPKVRELYRTLKRRGVQPWLDAVDLIPGQNWEVEIPKALLSSDAIIICLSPSSVDKEGYVQKEIKFALDKALEMPDGRIFLIPARLEECDLPFGLRQYQAVNLYEKEGYVKLMKALKLRASQLERNTVELPKEGEIALAINKDVKEKSSEPRKEKPDTKTSESLQNVDVGGFNITGGQNVINIGIQEKPETEKLNIERSQSKITRSLRRPNTAVIVALIGLAGTIIAALLNSSLIEKWFSPGPITTETAMASTFATTLQLAETPKPTSTLTPPVVVTNTPVFVLPETGYTIVDPADVFKMVAKADPFGKIAKEEYTPQEINAVNRTLFYTIDGTPDQPMQWRWYWCAATEKILDQNVKSIDVVFQADGRLIPHEQLAFTTYSYIKDDGNTGWCSTYSTVIKDWKPGVYHFIIASTIKSVINDGEATYSSGFQISDFTVKIHSPDLKTEIVDNKGVQMALVQGSSFQMGGGANADQQPIHAVYLDSYYMDAYEVSNALYKACVNADVCQPPKEISSTTHPSYYSDSKFDKYPMVNVNWSEAETYCQWRDARLPTEAEWEKAALGAGGRTYPWGNLFDCSYTNYLDIGGTQCIAFGDMVPVDKYPKGTSPFGVYGLIGNVSEWVSDWYSETYYSVSSLGNPQGADSGKYRVVRGGSWKDDATGMFPTIRSWYDPESTNNNIGFRCARDATP